MQDGTTDAIYVINPENLAFSHHLSLGLWSLTAVVCAIVVAARGRRGWGLVISVALLLPPLGALPFQTFTHFSLVEYVVEAALPMSMVLGGAGALSGVALGAVLRWGRSRIRLERPS
ncbi:hypothetical protein [Nitrospirillum sp. BR 11163]|uniref:hypothetical protein n=1 Tax=Nitrospirillum sp. BR 11163 TaxID=3104323 RepID=UPI002AFF190C|nr:hypothetical protein [Nitrospirillum sp. BR 11163]MEA1677213.1 hypothetical protein [Nitrospirillum sp. BR 11163]